MQDNLQENGEQVNSSILDRVMATHAEDRLQEADPVLVLQDLLARLEKREAEVLRRRHGLHGLAGETLEEVGKRYGVTRERVRQIEQAALQKVKKQAQNSSALQGIRQVVRSVFSQHGGILSDDHFFDRLKGSGTAAVENAKAAWNFFLSHLLVGEIHPLGKRENWQNGWYLPEVCWDAVDAVMGEVKIVFDEAGKPLTWEEFHEKFLARRASEKHAQVLARLRQARPRVQELSGFLSAGKRGPSVPPLGAG